ncbi:uncharacterized protein C8Q71DRAFT_862543 [Rhodofomes roseus]|uniref:Uncharacterized protein n=1 Tax=Rhodofomes roseus TaxID=34475 RepID=A0ABQ8K2L0_9APHY|nr:uncharacterized protein C8Q71DRAFT_862543 [Rhodofomes roseus]KAH9830537.1 hypothetical protein C8Q71DRAFT_862543 [Rhodofomes roseus]
MRDGKQTDKSAAPDGQQRFSISQLQQLVEALQLASEQEAERQMWRDVEDPGHPSPSAPATETRAQGAGASARGVGAGTRGAGAGTRDSGAGAQGAGTVAQSAGTVAPQTGYIAQAGHDGYPISADYAPPARPSSPRPPTGRWGTHPGVATSQAVVGNDDNGAGRCGGCCDNCGCYNRASEDADPGNNAGGLRWYCITKGKAIGVFPDWAMVGPLTLNVSGSLQRRHATFGAALTSFINAVNRGDVAVIM